MIARIEAGYAVGRVGLPAKDDACIGQAGPTSYIIVTPAARRGRFRAGGWV